MPHILAWLREGKIVNHDRDPVCVARFGALERYDGGNSFGALNVEFCMDRAMVLADAHGLREPRHRAHHIERPALTFSVWPVT